MAHNSTVKQNSEGHASLALHFRFHLDARCLPGLRAAPHLDSGPQGRRGPWGQRGASCTAPSRAQSGRGPRAWRWRSLRRERKVSFATWFHPELGTGSWETKDGQQVRFCDWCRAVVLNDRQFCAPGRHFWLSRVEAGKMKT